MRVLFLANNGDGFLDGALRAQRAGHKVKCFVRKYDPRTRPIGRGLVDLVPDFRPHMEWADLVLLEDNGAFMHEMDRWRDRGCRIIGGNAESASWEIDRTKGMATFKKAGIAVPPYREFRDYESAIAYVKRLDEPFVSKPCGAVDDKSLSYVAKTPEDLCYMLGRWKRKHGRPPCPFILQEKIDGTEFAVGAWWGPAGWADGWEENFEHKKMLPGDLGPNTGEMGTVMRYVRSSKLADRVLRPLEPMLDRLAVACNVDVNCIVDQDGTAWPLEFTMRFGWPAWHIEQELLSWEPIDFLAALAEGEQTRGAHIIDQVAVGVVLAIPPYPGHIRDYDDVVGIPLYGLEDPGAVESSFHPAEMQDGKAVGTALATAGDYVGVVTGAAETVSGAARHAYKRLKSLHLPASPFYRNDIGLKLRRLLPKLQEHGYAKELAYTDPLSRTVRL